MSMISTLDALEAGTDATSVPRAAVFQPKVKPRARKGVGGGGGGDTSSVPAKPPPSVRREKVAASAKPSPLISPAKKVATASEFSTRASASETAVSGLDLKESDGEELFACADGATPTTEVVAVASIQKNTGGVLEAAVEHATAESDSVPSNETLTTRDEGPPVSVRSNFRLLPTDTGPISSGDEDVAQAEPSSPEQDRGAGVASEPSASPDIEESELPISRNPNSAPSPKCSESERGGRSGQAVDDFRLSKDGEVEGEEEEAVVAEVDDEEVTIAEVVSSGKRGRKRKFPHSTSQSRMSRPDRDGLALKVDFSKTDLSNPGKLTMREIIRRAEAIERKKLKADGNKKSASNDGKQKQGAVAGEAPERGAVAMAPQVQVINGRIVINEQSLTIGAYATSRLNTDTYTRVEENAPRLNYNSYREKTPTERWKVEDTDVFYLALKQFGTDFELIQNLFPGRTRRQVKAKFKKEERNNPRRLQEALAHRPEDQLHYKDMITRLKGDEPDSSFYS